MQAVSLLRARYGANFLHALGEERPRALLSRVGLPEDLLTRPDELVPTARVAALANLCAAEASSPVLGATAAHLADPGGYGEFSSRLMRAASLHGAIRAFSEHSRDEYSNADFYFEQHDDRLLFCRGPFHLDKAAARSFELYVVVMMLQVARLALGPHWCPADLYLQCETTPELADLEGFGSTRLHFGCSRTVISVPASALASPLRLAGRAEPSSPGESCPPEYLRVVQSDGLAGSLRQALIPYLRSGQVSIHVAAEIVGISTRSLQRRLEEIGTSYSEVADRARFEVARFLLSTSDMKLRDIGQEVGYSDAAHFTRAFRRWSGISPIAFRRSELARADGSPMACSLTAGVPGSHSPGLVSEG